MKNLFKLILTFLILTTAGISSKAQSSIMDKSVIIANNAQFQWVVAIPGGKYINNQQLVIGKFSDKLGYQKFIFHKSSDDAVTISPCDKPDMVIGIPKGTIEQNKPLVLGKSNNKSDQQWELERLTGMTYIIRSRVNRDYVLAPLTTNPDARIVVQKYTGAKHQQWVILSTNSQFYNTIFKPKYE